MNDDDLITLRTYPDEIHAEMARVSLEAHDLPAIVSRDDCGGMEPYLNIANGARLLVHQGNADAALKILENPDDISVSVDSNP